MDERLRQARREGARSQRIAAELRAGRLEPSLVELAAVLGDEDASFALCRPHEPIAWSQELADRLRDHDDRITLAAAVAALGPVAGDPSVAALLHLRDLAVDWLRAPSAPLMRRLVEEARYTIGLSRHERPALTIARRALHEAAGAAGVDRVREALARWARTLLDDA